MSTAARGGVPPTAANINMNMSTPAADAAGLSITTTSARCAPPLLTVAVPYKLPCRPLQKGRRAILKHVTLPAVPKGDAAQYGEDGEGEGEVLIPLPSPPPTLTVSPSAAGTAASSPNSDSSYYTMRDLQPHTNPKYRPNVACHFVNERGQLLACLRTHGSAWQTVQGGVEEDDDAAAAQQPSSSSTGATASPYVLPIPSRVPTPIGTAAAAAVPMSSEDAKLMAAALREVEEEVGLGPAALRALGCEYLGEVVPPSRGALEAMLVEARGRRKKKGADPAAALFTPEEVTQLDRYERDPMRFFRYELNFQGKKKKAKGWVGQEQRQLLFYLPSEAIHSINLVPHPSLHAKQEFAACAWMTPAQFIPLTAPMKRRLMAYVFSCDYTRRAMDSVLFRGRGMWDGEGQYPPARGHGGSGDTVPPATVAEGEEGSDADADANECGGEEDDLIVMAVYPQHSLP